MRVIIIISLLGLSIAHASKEQRCDKLSKKIEKVEFNIAQLQSRVGALGKEMIPVCQSSDSNRCRKMKRQSDNVKKAISKRLIKLERLKKRKAKKNC